jgi:hypothetical protein
MALGAASRGVFSSFLPHMEEREIIQGIYRVLLGLL